MFVISKRLLWLRKSRLERGAFYIGKLWVVTASAHPDQSQNSKYEKVRYSKSSPTALPVSVSSRPRLNTRLEHTRNNAISQRHR